MKRIVALVVAIVAMSAPVTAARRAPDAQLAALLKGRVAGAPVRCITTSSLDSTRIVTGRAIVYRIGRRLYVNVPRGRAETLREDDVLITQMFGAQLCRNDQVQLMDRMTSIPRGILLLGDFVPYAAPAR